MSRPPLPPTLATYKWDVLLLVLGAAAVAVSLAFALIRGEPGLFARSGALAILAAVVVETRLAMRTHHYPETEAMMDSLRGFRVFRGLSRRGERVALAAHGYILSGTLIWAYGDLLLA